MEESSSQLELPINISFQPNSLFNNKVQRPLRSLIENRHNTLRMYAIIGIAINAARIPIWCEHLVSVKMIAPGQRPAMKIVSFGSCIVSSDIFSDMTDLYTYINVPTHGTNDNIRIDRIMVFDAVL